MQAERRWPRPGSAPTKPLLSLCCAWTDARLQAEYRFHVGSCGKNNKRETAEASPIGKMRNCVCCVRFRVAIGVLEGLITPTRSGFSSRSSAISALTPQAACSTSIDSQCSGRGSKQRQRAWRNRRCPSGRLHAQRPDQRRQSGHSASARRRARAEANPDRAATIDAASEGSCFQMLCAMVARLRLMAETTVSPSWL